MIEDPNFGELIWGLMVIGLIAAVFITVIGLALGSASIILSLGAWTTILGAVMAVGGLAATITLYLWFTRGVE